MVSTVPADPGYLNIQYFFARLLDLIQWIISLFTGDYSGSGLITLLKAIAALLVIVIIFVIVYSVMGIMRVRHHEHHELHQAIHDAQEKPEGSKNPRWNVVDDHINSDNQSDWKLGIIEADLMLEEMLDRAGYEGPTLGDKLRSAETGDFRTINYAKEAHGVRNAIAHQGSDFELSHTEARRVINLYEEVFLEFDYI